MIVGKCRSKCQILKKVWFEVHIIDPFLSFPGQMLKCFTFDAVFH